ncbi:MAG TPA: potassium channel family protein [Burkholderiales bacterium]|nr:potassium channel family protein [Burkholderiales bacterium]
MRRIFFLELWFGLKLVWPILSGLLAIMVVLGLVIAWWEDWPLAEGLYFAFVSGLTIGYGDLVPTYPISRALAIVIGCTGILLTGLVAALAVRALERATRR